ncbi:dinitrogenase iron-molybdenum cofactor biosynthesis protein [Azotobacter beijerinckii]|uniref:Nitrogen fixation protein NifX n=1 Tax=Azotobacter beijerinckii TaxID=170623 RepID=A0A1I4BRA8_9GAMM|nr:dinitrogenase iron-molybdenum cofactor biosynthesis protein [Azotobacter beijerinckii]SFB09466.1 nitrogen fixation protein NifX [Azotobacter beijerinckii]SFK71372.1 nitrogen fixation protein NifX [Azotobacter beijerinckii]
MSAQPPYGQAPLPAHLALRIALAARSLKGVDTAHLLRALIAAVGEPITEARLRKLRASRLRARLLEACGDSAPPALTDRQLHSALGLLKGRGVRMPEDPLPIPEPYREGEFPYSVRIACASDSGERLDGIFSNCARFLIYQISPRETRLVDLREPGPGRDDEDRHARRAELLGDCQLLYTLSIGGPAAAKVVRAGVHPVRLARAQPAREIVEELQRVLATAPPPWLAKAMGAEPDQRVRFTQ